LTQIAPASWADQADGGAVAVLAVVLVIGVASAIVTKRIAPALATAWGLGWLAVGRFTGEPESTITGIVAIVVAVALVAAGAWGVLRRPQATTAA
ncbi:tryptophan-rich sensory protein, partial [Microbacterium sp. ISL-103]|nr:tryptophan-rich sensory protein [Microbacterium sp. ISL-103]